MFYLNVKITFFLECVKKWNGGSAPHETQRDNESKHLFSEKTTRWNSGTCTDSLETQNLIQDENYLR
jgi:hypothetical protein